MSTPGRRPKDVRTAGVSSAAESTAAESTAEPTAESTAESMAESVAESVAESTAESTGLSRPASTNAANPPSTVPSEAAERGGLNRGLALLVAGAFFMEILDGTVIAPAAPAIAADLGVAAVDINVAITAYLLTLAVLIPISGWMADRFGARRVFMAAIAIFTLASAGCALATSLPMLTSTRILQGVGGAMMVPVGRLVVLRTTAKAELIKAIAFLTWPALIAPVIAPAVGGVLSTYASWRWIFVINLPLGIAGLFLATRLVPDVRAEGKPRLDWRGFALTAFGISALLVGMENIGMGPSNWSVVATGLALAAVFLSTAVVYLLRASRPLLDLRILRIASFRVTAGGGSLYRLVISAIPFLLPLFFQEGFGWSSAQAGVVIMALLQASTPLLVILAALALSGIFRSIGFSAYNSVAFADVEPARMTQANTLLSTVQELAAGLGVAVGALLLRLGDPVAAALGLPAGADAPFRVAFVLLALLMLVPGVEALLMPRSIGSGVTGKT